jgi:hypothetical protein
MHKAYSLFQRAARSLREIHADEYDFVHSELLLSFFVCCEFGSPADLLVDGESFQPLAQPPK